VLEVNNELELELEIVPLHGACEVDGEKELDGVEVALKIWLLVSKLKLILEVKDGLGLGDGLDDEVGMKFDELEPDVTVVEDWTSLVDEEKEEVVGIVVVVGNGIEEDETSGLEGEELGGVEVAVVVLVVVLVVVVVVLVVTSG